MTTTKRRMKKMNDLVMIILGIIVFICSAIVTIMAMGAGMYPVMGVGLFLMFGTTAIVVSNNV